MRAKVSFQIVKDFKIDGKWVTNKYRNNSVIRTYAYSLWANMMRRTSGNDKNTKSYHNCSVSDNFKNFQYFAEWCQKQVGYSLPGYSMDKDLLSMGDKTYSENNCVFIPRGLNNFYKVRQNNCGLYPRGVSWSKQNKMLQVQVNAEQGHRHLGFYEDVDTAYKVYKKAKEDMAQHWYIRIKGGEFVVDSRVTAFMKDWKLPEEFAHWHKQC